MRDMIRDYHHVELLKASDVVPRLGVTTGRAYQLIAGGIIPSVRIGGTIRILRDAWDEWIEEQRQRAMQGRRTRS